MGNVFSGDTKSTDEDKQTLVETGTGGNGGTNQQIDYTAFVEPTFASTSAANQQQQANQQQPENQQQLLDNTGQPSSGGSAAKYRP